MKIILLKVISISLAVMSYFGCNDGKLTREEAAKIIKQTSQLPMMEVGALTIEDRTFAMGATANLFEKLKQAGLVTYTFDSRGWSGGAVAYLTKKGRQFTVSGKYGTDNGYIRKINVRTSNLEFGGVTGIVEQSPNVVQVEYYVFRNNVTQFGRIAFGLDGGIINKTTFFTKYDDGWRMNN